MHTSHIEGDVKCICLSFILVLFCKAVKITKARAFHLKIRNSAARKIGLLNIFLCMQVIFLYFSNNIARSELLMQLMQNDPVSFLDVIDIVGALGLHGILSRIE